MKPVCRILFFLLLYLFVANTNSSAEVNNPQTFSIFPKDTPDSGFSKYNSKSKMLKFSKYVEKPIPLKVWKDTSAYFYFSDTATRDRFRFSVIGDYEYTAVVYFQIITKQGSCIYKDSFPLMTVLAMYFEGGGYYATRSQKEDAITEYAENLLSTYSLDNALEQLPNALEPEFTIHENHRILTMDGAQKFFCYSKKMDNNTFIGYDPVLGYALVFYDTQY